LAGSVGRDNALKGTELEETIVAIGNDTFWYRIARITNPRSIRNSVETQVIACTTVIIGDVLAAVNKVLVNFTVAVIVLIVADFGCRYCCLASPALQSLTKRDALATAEFVIIRAGLRARQAIIDESIAIVIYAVADLRGRHQSITSRPPILSATGFEAKAGAEFVDRTATPVGTCRSLRAFT